MKHSDYLFTPCKACGEEFPDTSREQDTRPAAEVWERRSRHWRKAALELKKQRDALQEAAKALVQVCNFLHDEGGRCLDCGNKNKHQLACSVRAAEDATKLAEGEAK